MKNIDPKDLDQEELNEDKTDQVNKEDDMELAQRDAELGGFESEDPNDLRDWPDYDPWDDDFDEEEDAWWN